jgi:hypothetical protein
MGASLKFVAKRGDQFQDRLRVGAKRGLRLDPGLRVRQRREDTAAVPDGAVDDPLIGQEEQDARSADQRQFRPVFRMGEVILEMKADVARSFFNDGEQVLVVAMPPIEGELSVPGASEMADE